MRMKKKDFDKFDSRWIELLQQSREDMMNDELMQHDVKQEDVSNYIQFLQNQHGVIAGDEEHKGSGGVGDISREEEHMGSGGAGDISTEEKHKGSG
ncbi:hypothetical protein MKW94_010342, partial [Papaver nudicaule]|nr:hypothetical protein [Papaver nudicaule]